MLEPRRQQARRLSLHQPADRGKQNSTMSQTAAAFRNLRIAAVQGPCARGDCPRPDIAALAIARIGDTYLCVALVLWSSERPEKKSQSPG
jgi:hypothetical protein